MPSNETPVFDVLSADENDLWEWAVERAGVENAATYIRDETLKAARDTDLARAELKGARDALTRYADSLGPAINARDVAERMSVLAFRDREYPAPKPAECRLLDGSVVRFLAERAVLERSFPDKYAAYRLLSNWPSLLISADTSADFDALKAFATTHAEGTDGR